MNSEDRRRLHLLEWLYDQPAGHHDVAPFYVGVNQPFDVSRADLLRLETEGRVEKYLEGGMVGRATLTVDGHAHVEQVRRLRDNKTERRWACRSGLVLWLERQGADSEGSQVSRAGFLTDELADHYGESFAEDEVDVAAAWLKSEGLIGGWTPDETDGPVLAFLTHAGLDCVERYSGDVRGWDVARRRVPNGATTINVVGVAQIATGDGATQQLELHYAVSEVRREIQGLVDVLLSFGAQGADELVSLYEAAVAEDVAADQRASLFDRLARRARDLASKVTGDGRAAVVSMLVSWVISNAHSVINAPH